MPNHCHNRVEIYGEPEEIKKIKNQLKTAETDFDFDTVIPTPNFNKIPNDKGELPTTVDSPIGSLTQFSDGSQDDRWYNWHIDNWGTKWNSYECEIDDESDEMIRYTFDTAWGPPVGVIDKLRELYPAVSVTAFYDEPGMEVAGYL